MGETLDSAGGVSVLRNAAEGAEWTFAYAPGAGSNLRDPFGRRLAEQLPGAGISLVRFQFPYQEAGSRRPDSPSDAPRDVARRAGGGAYRRYE